MFDAGLCSCWTERASETQADSFPLDDKKIKTHPLQHGKECGVTGLGETGCQLEAVQASEPQGVASMGEMPKYIHRVACAVGYDQYEYKQTQNIGRQCRHAHDS